MNIKRIFIKMFAAIVLTLLYLSKDATSVSYSTLDALYCDLSTMNYLFLKPDENGNLSVPNIDEAILRTKSIPIFQLMPNPQLKPSVNDIAVTDFNDITKKLYNISETVYDGTNNDDTYEDDDDFIDISERAHEDTRRAQLIYYDDTSSGNQTINNAIERSKITKVTKLQLQYLVHTRRKVEDALAHRKLTSADKRYRLGYLFNRLRRLSTEQMKLVTAAFMHRKSKYFNIKTLLRLYEKVVRYDVDVKDTIDLVRTTFAKWAPYDSVALKSLPESNA